MVSPELNARLTAARKAVDDTHTQAMEKAITLYIAQPGQAQLSPAELNEIHAGLTSIDATIDARLRANAEERAALTALRDVVQPLRQRIAQLRPSASDKKAPRAARTRRR